MAHLDDGLRLAALTRLRSADLDLLIRDKVRESTIENRLPKLVADVVG
jgi:hypothetical protein